MATEVIDFEAKVQGLTDYYRALEDLDPKNPQHGDVANPAFFYYSDGHHASKGLAESKTGVLFDMECHARVEYGKRGLGALDLREDTEELRAERADILAVMTSPLEASVRQERAERIAGLLGRISRGETVSAMAYDDSSRWYGTPRDVAADAGRSLFGVFRSGHISSRTLTIQYDTPAYFTSTEDVKAGEPLLAIELPKLITSSSDAVKLVPEQVRF